jgi:hypothetical protein
MALSNRLSISLSIMAMLKSMPPAAKAINNKVTTPIKA